MIKTDEDMLHKALSIAQQTRTSVAFVVNSVAQARYYMALARESYSVIAEGTILIQSGRITFPKGGQIMFLAAENSDNGNAWAGYQFSHVFVWENISMQFREFLRMKIRSPYRHDESLGLYDQFKVERYETY